MLRNRLARFVIRISLVVLASCSAGGNDRDPDASPDARVDARVEDPPAPRCGNGAIETGEACDQGNLGGATCETQGYQRGTLACDDTCALDTSGCQTCGDGRVSGDEECDSLDLDGQDCQSAGYAGGDLTCDVDTCKLDVSACEDIETLKNDDGVCDRHIGCFVDNNTTTLGNPQSLVECFDSGHLSPPFSLSQVTYTVSTQATAPEALNLEVYTWTGRGLPGTRIASIPLQAADRAQGPHTVTLDPPPVISTRDFCIGLNGPVATERFRLMFSDSATVTGASWIDAPACAINGFTQVADLPVQPPLNGNWCISATIEKVR